MDGYSKAGWLLLAASEMLGGDEPVSPRVRAAAWRMLAGVPGVHYLGRMTDTLGPRGVGVTWRDRQSPRDLREVFIVDPSTGRLPADENVYTKRDKGMPGGTLLKWSASLQAKWTDKPPPGVDSRPS